jgi:DNA-binding transcriptional ArsR family regulator
VKFPIAGTAPLIGDPASAAMLTTLLDGRTLPAGELARAANISLKSASMHLGQLLNGRFVSVSQQGRHRYYRITCPEVAHAIEALGVISTPSKRRFRANDDAICYARTCYDHLAGEVAVRLADAFQRDGLLIPANENDFDVTRRGEEFFFHWNIDVTKLRALRRSFARRCLDWTERRSHVAGALGAAIYQRFLEFRWIVRRPHDRIIRVTSRGARELDAFLP